MIVNGSEITVVVRKTVREILHRVNDVDVRGKLLEYPTRDIGEHPVTPDIYCCFIVKDKEAGGDKIVVGLVGLGFSFVYFVEVGRVVCGKVDYGDVFVVRVMFIERFVFTELFVAVDDSWCAVDVSGLSVEHVVYPVHIALSWSERYDYIPACGY